MNITFINRMMGIKFGGGENFDLNIAKALKKRGHKIRFIIGREWNHLSLPMDENEFEVIYIKTPYLRDIHYKIKPTNLFNKVISVGAIELDRLLFQIATYQYLRDDNWTDIYQLCGQPRLGAWLSKNAKKTSIWWPGPAGKRNKTSMSHCNINFAHGDAYNIIKENIYSNIKEVNLGIDIEKFCSIKKESKDLVEFLFVGRIVPIKNLSFLIKSFKEATKINKNIVLNIVGDGDEKELLHIKELARNEQNIKFLGKKSGDEIVNIYQNCDVFCLTSNYDNYPNVIFEAMACELPVIATNVGGIPSQVLNGITGILVENNNIEQLKDAILDLASDKDKRVKMGLEGRKRVENEFSWDKSAEQLEKLYRDINVK